MNKKKIIKLTISLIFLLGLICCILSVFSLTERKVVSINVFLSSNYYFFLVMRLCIYCFTGFLLLKLKKMIKTKVVTTEKKIYYNRLVFRISMLCVALICFNEVMLFIKMG
jgi:hypothetical protein